MSVDVDPHRGTGERLQQEACSVVSPVIRVSQRSSKAHTDIYHEDVRSQLGGHSLQSPCEAQPNRASQVTQSPEAVHWYAGLGEYTPIGLVEIEKLLHFHFTCYSASLRKAY